MSSCIVSAGSRDARHVAAVALLKRFCNINDVFVASPDDYDILSHVKLRYNTVYCVGHKFIDPCLFFPDITHVVNFIKTQNPNLIGFTFFINDVTKNYLATGMFKTMDFNGSVLMMESIIDRYIVDKSNVKPIMEVKDTNVFDLCFKHGAKICYLLDKDKQFVIATDRHGDIQFDEDLFAKIAEIVPERKFLYCSPKVIAYGTQQRPLPRYVKERCEYNSEQIYNVLGRWYLHNYG